MGRLPHGRQESTSHVDAGQHGHLLRKHGRLIHAVLPSSSPGARDGNEHVDMLQMLGHGGGEDSPGSTGPSIFQLVDERPRRPLVQIGGANRQTGSVGGTDSPIGRRVKSPSTGSAGRLRSRGSTRCTPHLTNVCNDPDRFGEAVPSSRPRHLCSLDARYPRSMKPGRRAARL